MTFYLKCVLQLLRLVYVVKRQILKKILSECKHLEIYKMQQLNHFKFGVKGNFTAKFFQIKLNVLVNL